MKYIMFEKKLPDDMVQIVPVIFPEALVHSDVAEVMRRLKGIRGLEPVAAGSINMLAQTCYGKSETLQLNARSQDAETINFVDYLPVRTI